MKSKLFSHRGRLALVIVATLLIIAIAIPLIILNTATNPTPPTQDGYDHNAPELHPTGVIPAGSYYGHLDADTGEATWHDTMPEQVSNHDFYLSGDYEYLYIADRGGWWVQLATEYGLCGVNKEFPMTDRNQTSYGPILESINGKPITDISAAFYKCTLLEVAPVIPNGVINMIQTYMDCESLTKAPIIPSNVKKMDYAFCGCTSLTGDVEVHAKLTDCVCCFYDTVHPITITGSCLNKVKIGLSMTANNNNVSY